MHHFTPAVKAAEKFLESLGVETSLIIAVGEKDAAASMPADNETTAVLVLALLDKAPKEVREIVGKHFDEGGNLS